MDVYHGAQVVFTLAIWLFGILLVASARKNQKKKGSRSKTVVFYTLGALIVLSMIGQLLSYTEARPVPTQTSQQVRVQVAQTPPTRAELLKLVNAERKKAGVAPLKEDKRLDWSAQQKADDMQKYNYFGHFRNGVFIGQQLIDQTGISCRLDSENLQDETNLKPITPRGIVEVWKTSKSHYEAMISSKYTLTGFGITDNQTVEHFCQP